MTFTPALDATAIFNPAVALLRSGNWDFAVSARGYERETRAAGKSRRKPRLLRRIYLGYASGDLPAAVSNTHMVHLDPREYPHDPRLFVFRGELWMSYGYVPLDGKDSYRVRLACLGNDQRSFSSGSPEVFDVVIPPTLLPSLRHEEKNWVFFGIGQDLYVVYEPDPLEVFRLKRSDDHHVFVATHMWCDDRSGLGVRGGSPPVLNPVSGCLEMMGHIKHSKTRYHPVIVKFQPGPPFQLVEYDYDPPIERDIRDAEHIVFPCGMVFAGRRRIVTYGFDDVECRVTAV